MKTLSKFLGIHENQSPLNIKSNSSNTIVHLVTSDSLERTEQTSSRHTRTLTERAEPARCIPSLGAATSECCELGQTIIRCSKHNSGQFNENIYFICTFACENLVLQLVKIKEGACASFSNFCVIFSESFY